MPMSKPSTAFERLLGLLVRLADRLPGLFVGLARPAQALFDLGAALLLKPRLAALLALLLDLPGLGRRHRGGFNDVLDAGLGRRRLVREVQLPPRIGPGVDLALGAGRRGCDQP